MGMNSFGMRVVGLSALEDLLGSLKMKFTNDAVYIVGPSVEYAVYHELGTSRMEARPFARPAAEQVQNNLGNEIQRFLDSGIADSNEDDIVRAAALAVERRMKLIVRRKEIWDTGNLHASIGIEKVS